MKMLRVLLIALLALVGWGAAATASAQPYGPYHHRPYYRRPYHRRPYYRRPYYRHPYHHRPYYRHP